jgi:DNA gyrase subunit B
VLLSVTSIKKIKPEHPFVYDLAVNVNENFAAGSSGILVHNTDGSHIRTLLLTLFFRYFKDIIEGGYLYIAQPPLYKIQKGKNISYAYNDQEKEEVMKKFGQITEKNKKENSKDKKKESESEWEVSSVSQADGSEATEGEIEEENQDTKTKISGLSVQRYKGLGEMNPGELWETTMDPEKRVLLRVDIEDAEKADKIFDVLMGSEVLPRKKFIQNHAKEVKNLDI